MKDSIASLDAFHYHCPHCGTTVNIDYGFLYHDAGRRFMVFYGPTENDEQRADRDMAENHQVFERMSANQYISAWSGRRKICWKKLRSSKPASMTA